MLLLVATAPIAACKMDRDEVLGADRNRPVPYPERLYTPHPPASSSATVDGPNRARSIDGGVQDGASGGAR